MHCSSISLSIAIASVAVLFVGVDAHDENPASLSSWGLSSININHNNDKFAPSEETAIVAPANSALITADSPPSCSANQKRNSKVRRNLSCKPEDRKSTAPTGQHSEPGQESNDPNVNKIPNEAASNSFTTVDYADFIRDKDLCPVAFVGFQRMFAVCDHGSLMSRVILQDIIVLFDVTPGALYLSFISALSPLDIGRRVGRDFC